MGFDTQNPLDLANLMYGLPTQTF
ncbi:uncharacterized protein G2W53_010805 [Senna tora]|uniref:Uncharacterized protein n=1 Tax=Senna tora TaxID=362788 RepID=A0A835C9V8_9FABA|nr:uncharacterized protein G2W53_010805 [Senna tora]